MSVFVVVCSALLLFLRRECFLLRVPFFVRQGVAQKGAMGVFIFTPTPPGNDLEPVKLCYGKLACYTDNFGFPIVLLYP